MRVVIAAVGRLKDGPERGITARYLDRVTQIGRNVSLGPIEIIEVSESRARRPQDRMAEEALALRAAAGTQTPFATLDERGRALSSAGFAEDMARRRDNGCSVFGFMIGGADGLSPDLVRTAEFSLAFGGMTWPHQFVRMMLAEQIYRATTILAGHPYHRA